MNCFICKKEIKPEVDSISGVAYIRLPIGEMGYVHTKHHGVTEEAMEQMAKESK
jgi:hypothetical protein